MTINRRHALFAVGGGVIAGAVVVGRGTAAGPANPVNVLDSPGGAAIKGYDPVAYFVANRPVHGTQQHRLEHGGATWLFANATNRALFEQNPNKYLPAYGGYCAYEVAQGYLVKIEPDAWSIRNGRLYLNYDAGVRKQWEMDPAGYVAAADRKWPALVTAK